MKRVSTENILSEIIESDHIEDFIAINTSRAKIHSKNKHGRVVHDNSKSISDRSTSLAIAQLMNKGVW